MRGPSPEPAFVVTVVLGFLAAQHSPELIALAVVAIAIMAAIALSLRNPVWGIALLAASVPLQAAGAVDVSGLSLTATKIILFGLVVGWIPRAVRGRSPLDAAFWGYGLVAVSLVMSVVAVENYGSWAGATYQWLAAMLTYVVARTEIRTNSERGLVLGGMAAGVIGLSLYAIFQVATRDGPPSFVSHGLMRAYGTFGWPNPLAAYLELSLPLFAAVLLLPFSPGRLWPAWTPLRLLLAVALAMGCVVFVFTQSMGGLLGMTAAVVVLLGFSSMPIPLLLIAAGCLVVASALLVQVWNPVWKEAVDSLVDPGEVTPGSWANEERRAHWTAAIAMWRDAPLTGQGAGEFNNHFREYTTQWRFRISRGHAHNGYLQFAAESGFFGLLAFLTWGVSLVVMLVRDTMRAIVIDRRAYAIGALACVLAFLVHSLVDYLNVLSLGIQLAIVVALGVVRPECCTAPDIRSNLE